MLHDRPLKFAAFILFFWALFCAPAHADCTNPAGKEAAIFYNGDYHTYQFCNSTAWIPFGALGGFVLQSNYVPTVPAGSGYFVLTKTQYNGNLGDLSGANAKCLTELGTTNTTWMGYTAANTAGLINATHVHAFICSDSSGCNNLMPVTTYYFANANDASWGGASFTTDTNGVGPNDAADWSAANYFHGNYTYWSSRFSNGGETTQWNTGGEGCNCGGAWGSSSSGSSGCYGGSTNIDHTRWEWNSATCNTSKNLICYIDP